MTRAFDPRDILRVRSLQDAGCSLDLEGDVLSGRSPLRRAVSDVIPLGETRTATFLSHPADGSDGLVQTRWRRHHRSADVVYMAPALGTAPGAAHVWHRLLHRACQAMGEAGAERVFATVDEDDQVALQLFRRLGFVPMTGDTVYVLAGGDPSARGDDPGQAPRSAADGTGNGGAATPHSMELTLVDEAPEHGPEIRRMVLAALPDNVRAHAEPEGCDWETYPVGGWMRPALSGRVLLADDGAVAAAWRWFAGPGGWWLHVVADPDGDAGAVLGRALAEARREGAGARDAYCAAPGYDAALHLALRDRDFHAARRRFRLVKHVAIRLIEPAWRERAAEALLDKAAPQTPTAAHVEAAPLESRRTKRS